MPVDPTTGTITVSAVYASTDVSIDVIGSFAQPNDTYRYQYGIDGLRAAKQLDGDTTAGYLWRHEYTWDTASGLPVILAEHRDSQTPLAQSGTSYLIYGPGGMPIYQLAADGQPMYFHQDHQGSTRLVTAANGTVRETLSYDQTGAIDGRSNPWIEQPILGYTGQQQDLETGFLYLRARYYDPTTSQFLSIDPRVALTHEPYGYAGSNPANFGDPSGLDRCWRNGNGEWVCGYDPLVEAAENLSYQSDIEAIGECIFGGDPIACVSLSLGRFIPEPLSIISSVVDFFFSGADSDLDDGLYGALSRGFTGPTYLTQAQPGGLNPDDYASRVEFECDAGAQVAAARRQRRDGVPAWWPRDQLGQPAMGPYQDPGAHS